MLGQMDGDVEEVREGGSGEEMIADAVGSDAAFAHEEHAADFGNDVGNVVGDEEDARAGLREGAEEGAKLALGEEVEGVGRLIEEEHGGAVSGGGGPGAYEGAGDHNAALLAGGHFADLFVREREGVDFGEGGLGSVAHGWGDDEVGPEGGGGEEAGEDGVEAGGGEGGFAGQVGGDEAHAAAEVGEVPAIAAKDADFCFGVNQGVKLAGDGFEEGGFAAAVWAEDGEVFACVEGEGDVVEDGLVAAGDRDVLEIEDGWGHGFKDSG